MINPTNMALYLDTVGSFPVELFYGSNLTIVLLMVISALPLAVMIRFLDWAADGDAKDKYAAIVEEDELAISVVDSLYQALAMQSQMVDHLVRVFTLPPHIASLPSMEELMEVPEPSLQNQSIVRDVLDSCFEDLLLEEDYQQYMAAENARPVPFDENPLVEDITTEEFEQDFEDAEDEELDEVWTRLEAAMEARQHMTDVEYPDNTVRTMIIEENLGLAALKR